MRQPIVHFRNKISSLFNFSLTLHGFVKFR